MNLCPSGWRLQCLSQFRLIFFQSFEYIFLRFWPGLGCFPFQVFVIINFEAK